MIHLSRPTISGKAALTLYLIWASSAWRARRRSQEALSHDPLNVPSEKTELD